jgi:prolipoprotein diacylglyceryltransferase
VANRVPVQLIGALITLVLIWALELASKRFHICGTAALIGLFALSTELFFLSFLRADPVPIWNGMRLDAWGALVLMVVSALGLAILLLKSRTVPKAAE